MDHWQARLRGQHPMVRKPAWRLNVHKSFLMSDGKVLYQWSMSLTHGPLASATARRALWRVSLRGV